MPRIRAATIEEHKRRTRAEILDAAAVLFRDPGYSEVGLGELAAAVGIGRTTLYEYFADKEDVLVKLVESRIPAVVQGLVTGMPDGVSNRERLGELIVRGLEFVSSDDDLGATLHKELPRLSEPAQHRLRRAHGALEDEVIRLCRAGIASGEFRAFDPIDAGRLVFTMIMAASQALVRDADAKQKMHEAADTLVRFVFEGLAIGD
jgi:AcrR family transcriptional regulator